MSRGLNAWWLGLLWLGFVFFSASVFSEDTVCARVKIEIKQELTLERQAFDAEMKIHNTLPDRSLTNVKVDVLFSDTEGNSVKATSDANDLTAKFYIRVNSMTGVDNITGTGQVAADTTAEIHWLIIPAPGAANGVANGKLYMVGAALSYTFGGESQTIEVAPDSIRVKPLPQLTLDYFLPGEVYGDDAFTTQIEPPVPYNLGVRVRNNGSGAARNVKIESAQPKIIENLQGLLVGFEIIGSTVNDKPAAPTLRTDFGDIDANKSGVARWLMTTTLSGRFVEFTARFIHADELGGQLTSLLQAVNTHFLVRDVLVDLPGRDGIRDFLAEDGLSLKVYESDHGDAAVVDQSAVAALQAAETRGLERLFNFTVPAVSGPVYAKAVDPFAGTMELRQVIRADGKVLLPANAWLSKTRPPKEREWQYHFNVFDTNSSGRYTAVFAPRDNVPLPPVLQFIADRTVEEGKLVSFIIEASDPNGTVPSLTAAPLPAGAGFVDQNNGTALFSWTPVTGQAGVYPITYTASDGVLTAARSASITVTRPVTEDGDNDGLPDAWERLNFGGLDRDGSGDFDGDGISDRDEFLRNTDPATPNLPGAPAIDSPADGGETNSLQPDLVVNNSAHLSFVPVTYQYELYRDMNMTQRVAEGGGVLEGVQKTTWQVPAVLDDNTYYFWRARASDGTTFSPWVTAEFFVNRTNDTPGTPAVSRPRSGATVDRLTPELEVSHVVDVDEDVLNYQFEVYADETLTQLVAESPPIDKGAHGMTAWTVTPALQQGGRYYWRVVVSDEQGAIRLGLPASFIVNTANPAPGAPVIQSPSLGAELTERTVTLTVTNARDANGETLTYQFELDEVETFDSPRRQRSPALAEGIATTGWAVNGLADNTHYFWRVRTSDGAADSGWTRGRFFVNTQNDTPMSPVVENPAERSWSDTLTPILDLYHSHDADGGALRYRFELFTDALLSNRISEAISDAPSWTVPLRLADKTRYHWRARAEDGTGAVSPWTATQKFLIVDNGVNDAPTLRMLTPHREITPVNGHVELSWTDGDPDDNATIALYYDTDALGADGTLIVDGLLEDDLGRYGQYNWNITALASGTYYVYGVIGSGAQSVTHYAPGRVIIPAVVSRGALAVTAPSVLTTSESGGTVTLNLVLDRAPTSDVTVIVTSSNVSEGTVNPTQIVFTPSNWNVAQAVTVTGFNDCAVDGTQTYTVNFGALISGDARFTGVQPIPVTLGNVDDDTPFSHPALKICRYQLVSSTRVSRVEFDYVYKIDATNVSTQTGSFSATVRSNSATTVVGDGTINFGPVAAGKTITSTDTITLRINRLYRFDPAVLVWEVQSSP